MLKAYKYELNPNNTQKEFFAKSFGCCRWVYNYMLNKRIETYTKDKTRFTAFDLIKDLTILKKNPEFIWLNEVDSQSLQQSIRNMDSAFTKFFRDKKGFPNFKNKHNKQSCKHTVNVQIDFELHKIKIPKIGWINFYLDREFEGKINTVTVSKNCAGKYFVSILVDNSLPL